MWISLPHDNNRQFHISSLIRMFIDRRITEIVQGQQHLVLANHTKPNSLDFWIRSTIANYPDVAQATNSVIDQVCGTGLFERAQVTCQDNQNICNGIRLVDIPGGHP
jgi:hypothetical protein